MTFDDWDAFEIPQGAILVLRAPEGTGFDDPEMFTDVPSNLRGRIVAVTHDWEVGEFNVRWLTDSRQED